MTEEPQAGPSRTRRRHRSRVRGTEWLIRVTAVLLVAYAALLVHQEVRFQGRELFPAFKWSLFSAVPGPTVTDYTVRLVAVNGRTLPEPVYFADAQDIVAESNSPSARRLMRGLGRTLDRGHLIIAADRQSVFESRFLAGLGDVEYEVVRIVYDVLDNYRCDCYIEETVVATIEVVR